MSTASAYESAELTISLPPRAERCVPTLPEADRADFARLHAAAPMATSRHRLHQLMASSGTLQRKMS
jgi:hypothetical protein